MNTMRASYVLGIVLVVLLSGCSSLTEQPLAPSSPLTFVVSGEGAELPSTESIVYETSMGESDLEWLSKTRESRSELNRVRYESDEADSEEERLDRKKSSNWHTYIDGESRRGYDVVLEEKGKFEDWEESDRSSMTYGYIVRYGYG